MGKDWNPKVNKVDSVNVIQRTLPIGGQNIELFGPTVRSLIKMLQGCDPDDMIIYMAEVTPEMEGATLLYGVVGGVASKSEHGVSFLIGPEVNKAMKKQWLIWAKIYLTNHNRSKLRSLRIGVQARSQKRRATSTKKVSIVIFDYITVLKRRIVIAYEHRFLFKEYMWRGLNDACNCLFRRVLNPCDRPY